MRCDGPIARPMARIVAVLFSVGLVGCNQGPQVVTSIEFDGNSRSIATKDVVCTKQLNGGLVILVDDGRKRTVRIQLTQQGRLVVQRAGLRYDDMAGFVADPREVTATKVDDTYTFSGRMPPNPGESQWHSFKIATTCPGYQDAGPPPVNAPRGAP
jgi:Mycobacterium 19 kDa lipoprotein antigen